MIGATLVRYYNNISNLIQGDWGEGGAAFPKYRGNPYSVVHHFEGQSRTRQIHSQNFGFIAFIEMACRLNNESGLKVTYTKMC